MPFKVTDFGTNRKLIYDFHIRPNGGSSSLKDQASIPPGPPHHVTSFSALTLLVGSFDP